MRKIISFWKIHFEISKSRTSKKDTPAETEAKVADYKSAVVLKMKDDLTASAAAQLRAVT